jgi:hypothetical protein
MRRVVITIVSLLAVLVHWSVGCCAHHEHAQVAANCPHSHDHQEGGSHDDHDTPPIDPLSHQDCHETHCDATLASIASAPATGGLNWWLPVRLIADELSISLAGAKETSQPFVAKAPLSLRAHLRFCVLLI